MACERASSRAWPAQPRPNAAAERRRHVRSRTASSPSRWSSGSSAKEEELRARADRHTKDDQDDSPESDRDGGVQVRAARFDDEHRGEAARRPTYGASSSAKEERCRGQETQSGMRTAGSSAKTATTGCRPPRPRTCRQALHALLDRRAGVGEPDGEDRDDDPVASGMRNPMTSAVATTLATTSRAVDCARPGAAPARRGGSPCEARAGSSPRLSAPTPPLIRRARRQ